MKNMRIRSGLLILLLIGATLAACAPTTVPPVTGPPAETEPDPREERAVDIASTIFHRMELGNLENGSYSADVLIDLELPRGIAWTMVTFPGETFEMRVTDDLLPGTYWLVTPDGIRRMPA